MATEAGELLIKISADVESMKAGLKQLTSNMGSAATEATAKGVIIGMSFVEMGKKVIEFGIESVRAFGEQEAALARLSRQVGTETANAFADYDSELQKTTTFTDESIIAMQSQLANFGLLPGSIKEATKPLLDYAAATGKSLPEAATVLTKALSGNSRELKQMGLDLNVSDGRAGNLDRSIAFLSERFRGMSEQLKGTAIGTIENFNNRIHELQESIGKDLVVAIDFWRPKAESMMAMIEKIMGASRSNLSVNALTIAKLQEERNAIIAKTESLAHNINVNDATRKSEQDRLQTITRQIVELKKQEKQETATAAAANKAAVDMSKGLKKTATDAEEAVNAKISAMKLDLKISEEVFKRQSEMSSLVTQKKIADSKQELAQIQADQTQITTITQLETEKRMLASKTQWEANASFSDQFKVKMADDIAHNTAAWVDMAGTMIDSFSSSMAKMIVEGGKFSEVMKNLWKQLAEMVIQQILRMIVEWSIWEAFTGGAGGFAGGFLGHGAAGGMINEPSMVIGMRSGTSFVAGEAGPESFGPAGAANTLNHGASSGSSGGGNSGGGGDIHINISGTFVEGNASKWQRLIQEQIAPQIRRLAMKDPNSLITRKRGSLS